MPKILLVKMQSPRKNLATLKRIYVLSWGGRRFEGIELSDGNPWLSMAATKGMDQYERQEGRSEEVILLLAIFRDPKEVDFKQAGPTTGVSPANPPLLSFGDGVP